MSRFLKSVLIALAPPLLAFAGERLVLASVGARWLLMVAAVIVSAAEGSMATGLVATIISAILGWWYLLPSARSYGTTGPEYLSVAVFLAVGFAISLLHERLRRSKVGLEEANERLVGTMAELSESQRFLQGILDYSPNAVVIKTVDGRYTMVNNGFRAITGLALTDARGHCDADLFPPALARRLHANDNQALATRKTVMTEETVELHGVRRVFVLTKFPLFDQRGSIFALGGIWTDITRRKRDEEALHRAADDLRAAQHVAHVGSWRWDTRAGELVWSEELYRIFGLDPAEPRQAPLHLDAQSMLSDDGKAELRTAVEKTLADGTPYMVDVEFTRKDGTRGWLATRGEAIRDETGRIVGLMGTCADITRIKELERLRDEWTSVIAHDLRQPIGTVLAASEVLPTLRENALNEEERMFARRIHSAGQALRRMVDDLLDMSLLESNRLRLERKVINAKQLVEETVSHLAHVDGIERVHIHCDDTLPPVSADAMRVQQVLGNLVSNAIKYGDGKSEIGIRVTRRAEKIEIAVSNRGRGIPPDELPKLFNRFMRSREARGSGVGGLGLGLYIANGIIQAHGGTLRAESTPGEMTTFTVCLPVEVEQRKAA